MQAFVPKARWLRFDVGPLGRRFRRYDKRSRAMHVYVPPYASHHSVHTRIPLFYEPGSCVSSLTYNAGYFIDPILIGSCSEEVVLYHTGAYHML